MPSAIRIFAFGLMLCIQLSVGAQRQAVWDTTIRQLLAQHRIPGASFLVLHNGQVLHSAGYGFSNLEHRVAARPETVYELASISKPITGMAVMRLVADGKLALDSSIAVYFGDAVPSTHRGITVRHLLNHTAGLPTDHFQYNKLYAPTPLRYTVREQMADLFKLPLAGAPGKVFQYSNAGYFLLGALVEKASGQPYPVYVQRAVFDKAGMRQSSFLNGDSVVANRAQGYTLRKGRLVRFALETTVQALDANGFSGLRSTTGDLARLAQRFLSGDIVPMASAEQMLTLSRMADGSVAGFEPGSKMTLSWFVRPVKGLATYSHSGYTGTVLVMVPERQLVLVLLTNLGYGIGLLGDAGFDAAEEGFRLVERALELLPGASRSGHKQAGNKKSKAQSASSPR